MDIFAGFKKLWAEIYKNIMYCKYYYRYKYSGVNTSENNNQDENYDNNLLDGDEQFIISKSERY